MVGHNHAQAQNNGHQTPAHVRRQTVGNGHHVHLPVEPHQRIHPVKHYQRHIRTPHHIDGAPHAKAAHGVVRHAPHHGHHQQAAEAHEQRMQHRQGLGVATRNLQRQRRCASHAQNHARAGPPVDRAPRLHCTGHERVGHGLLGQRSLTIGRTRRKQHDGKAHQGHYQRNQRSTVLAIDEPHHHAQEQQHDVERRHQVVAARNDERQHRRQHQVHRARALAAVEVAQHNRQVQQVEEEERHVVPCAVVPVKSLAQMGDAHQNPNKEEQRIEQQRPAVHLEALAQRSHEEHEREQLKHHEHHRAEAVVLHAPHARLHGQQKCRRVKPLPVVKEEPVATKRRPHGREEAAASLDGLVRPGAVHEVVHAGARKLRGVEHGHQRRQKRKHREAQRHNAQRAPATHGNRACSRGRRRGCRLRCGCRLGNYGLYQRRYQRR